MSKPILCSNPQRQFFAQREKIESAISKVLNSDCYILGSEVENFEKEFARYNDSLACIGVNSGTDALILSLRALGVGFGDEVITPSHTAVATVAAVVSCGATPVFIDVDSTSFTIDPNLLAGLVTSRTKAVIAVHLYGNPSDMTSLLEIAHIYNLYVVEDCAQAHGAELQGKKVGTFGIVGCFSFYPTKNLGAIGDGGAVITNDPVIADRLRLLRQYGWNSNRASVEPSGVSRLDEIQAAILRVKLPLLDYNNDRRRFIASVYRERLSKSEIVVPVEQSEAKHVYHLFVVRTQDRNKMISYLNSLDIFPGIHYSLPVHLQPGYMHYTTPNFQSLKTTELLAKEILSLPMFPELIDSEIDRVCEGVLSVR
jgi:dTDP-4-amino-4,6-dideoxygalactose transaminase